MGSAAVTSVPLANGQGSASLVRLEAGDLAASVCSFGATLVGLEAPDRDGRTANCVATLADPAQLAMPELNPHLGGIVGRVANRIAGAGFTLDGVAHRLEANEGAHTLHGAGAGWDRRPWHLEAAAADGRDARAVLSLSDPDGCGGFPGAVEARAVYSLDAHGALTLDICVEPTVPTPVALTNHVYWNLAGRGTICAHRLRIDAPSVLELGPGQIPTGAANDLGGGPFDLRTSGGLGRLLAHPDLRPTGGFDHTYLLAPPGGGPSTSAVRSLAGDQPSPPEAMSGPSAASLCDPQSGRLLEVWTNQPALHLYTGNHLDGQPGASGPLPRHGGVCLEAGTVPNAPNLRAISGPGLGTLPVDVTTRPGRAYRWITRWRLGRTNACARVAGR
ncbi:MAG: aldose epimerase family protein [Microthrixaceae bacterium]